MSSASQPWRQRLRTTTALQAVAVATLMAAPMPARAQLSPTARPTGGQVVAGQASIAQTTTTTTVDQSTQRAAVNWQGFDVGSQHTVDFVQPSASAVTLNRVMGPNPSEIAGRINANGQIVVVNQAGVLFDKGAQINTSGIVVSAAGISNANFMAGKMVFDQAAKPGAVVENRGTITVQNQGLAALVAPQVRNSGVIRARMGTVILAGAEAETLDLYGDGLVSINVTKQVRSAPDGTKALVTNTGVVEAKGGSVVLTADAVDGVVQTLVNAGGTISADSTASRTGRVVIGGRGGDVRVEGVVTAEGNLPGASGGAVKIAGSNATVLAAGSRVSVSGSAGGGVVALGTTLARARGKGTGTAAAKTKTLVVEQGATVTADATANGNGGRVVLLSSGNAAMAGTITAKGGPGGGNGGFVELSGDTLTLAGHVDAGAPAGKIGALLLDPSNLWISDTDPMQTGETWFSPATLQGQNANVTLFATDNAYVASTDPATYMGSGTPNTLNLGAHTLTLTGGIGLTIDQGFGIVAGGVSLSTMAGPITLNGASGVTGGLITAMQLGALAPTSIVGPTATPITVIMAGAGGIALGAATLGSAANPLGVLDISTTAGGVTQATAGAIDAITLQTASNVAGGSVGLIGANQIGTLAAFGVTGGDFTLIDSGTLAVHSVSASDIFLQAGTLALVSTPTLTTGSATAGRLSLVADALTGSAAALEAGTVEVAPLTAGNAVDLGGPSSAGTLGISSANLGAIDATTLRVGAFTNVPAGGTSPGTPVAGTIDIASAVDLTGKAGTLDVETTGTFGQSDVLAVGTLVGNANDVELPLLSNAVTNIGSLNAGTIFLQNLATSTLTVSGPLVASLVEIVASNITIPGTITATSGAFLSANTMGTISEGMNGVIATPYFSADDGAVTLGGTNAVGALTTFFAKAFTLNDPGVPTLTVAGTITAATVTLTAPNIDIPSGGTIMATTSTMLTANGTGGKITEDGVGVISTALLTGSANGAATFDGANVVTNLGTFAAAGFTLDDPGVSKLSVTGAVAAPTVVLGAPSIDIAMGGTIAATTSTSLTANGMGGTITEDGVGVISTALLTGSANGAATFDGANVVTNLGTFAAAGFTLDDPGVSKLSVTGAVTAPTVVLSAPSIDIPTGGTISATTSTMLTATGASGTITEDGSTGGAIDTALLSGSAGGAATLNGANAVTNLGTFTAGGGFTLDDRSDLKANGLLSAGGDIVVMTTGVFEQDSGVISSFGNISLSGVGFTQNGGLVGAYGTLTADATTGDFSQTAGVLAAKSPGTSGNSVTIHADGNASQSGGAVYGNVVSAAAGGTNDVFTIYGTPAYSLPPPNGPEPVQGPGVPYPGAIGLGSGPATTPAKIIIIGQTIDVDRLLSAGTVDLQATQNISETTGGTIDAGTLTGSAGGSATLDLMTNHVTDLAAFSTVEGFTFRDESPLTVDGLVTSTASATTIMLTDDAVGPVAAITLGLGGTLQAGTLAGMPALHDGIVDLVTTQPSANVVGTLGTIEAGTLTGTVDGSATLDNAMNAIGTLGGFSTVGNFTLADTAALTVAGTVTTTNSGNTIKLTDTSAGPGAAITLATGAMLGPNGGTVDVNTTAGGIAEMAGATIDAASLTSSTGVTGNAIFAGTSNAITGLTHFTATGTLSVTDTGPITVSGTVNGTTVAIDTTDAIAVAAGAVLGNAGGTIDLGTTAGGINEVAGAVIDAASLTSSNGVTGNAIFAGTANAITGLTHFTTNGTLSLTDTGPITLSGTVNGADVTIGTTDAVAIASGATVGNPGATIDLSSTAGGINQSSGAVIDAASLTSTNGVTGNAIFAGTGNAVTGLTHFTTNGTLSLTDTGPLTVTGTVDGANVTIGTTDAISVASGATLGNPGATIDLSTTAGGVNESAGAVIDAASLTSSNGVTGNAIFAGTANAITGLTHFTSTGDLNLTDNGPLTISGMVNGANVTIGTTDAIAVASGATLGNPGATIDLSTTAGGVSESSEAVIDAASLTSSNGVTGNAIFAGTGNAITGLTHFITTGDLSLTDTGPLTVSGTVNGANVTIGTTDAIAIASGAMLGNPGATIDLSTSAGGINESTGAVIDAASLASSNGVTGNAIFAGTGNAITGLTHFTANGTLSVTDTGPITLSGTVNGANVTIGTTDAIAIASGATVGNAGATIDLSTTAGGINESSGAVIDAASLTSNNGVIGNAIFAGTANAVTGLTHFTTNGTLSVTDTGPITLSGTVNGTSVTVGTTDAIAIANGATVGNAGGTIDLSTTAGGINESSGAVIDAASLTSSDGVTGNAIFAGTANAVTGLTHFTTTGTLALTDTGPITVTGTVNGANVTIGTTDAILIASGANLGNAGATIDLSTSAGGVNESAGAVIDAASLTSSNGVTGDAIFAGTANAITGLTHFTATGNLDLTDTAPLTISGTVNGANVTIGSTSAISLASGATLGNGNATVDLSTGGGGINESTGAAIDAALLTSSHGVVGNALLPGANNAVATLGPFATTGAFLLDDSAPLTVVAAVTAATDATIAVTGAANNLTVNPGVAVQAAGGAATLTAGGSLTQDGAVTASTTATLTAADGTLTQAGSVAAGTGLTLAATNGALNQAGAVTTTSGTASLTAGTSLAQTGSVVDAGGNALLVAGGNLAQSGTVTASAGATLTATAGTLSQTGAVTANGGPADLTAFGNLTQGPAGVTTGQSGAALVSQTGTISQQGRVVARNGAASLSAGADIVQAGTVQAANGNAVLLAAGNLTQSNAVIAATTTALTATNGTLDQTGAVTAGTGVTLTATNGALDQAGSVVTGSGDATLTAGNGLSQTGMVLASNGNAALTAMNGALGQSGTVTAGNGVALTAGNGTLSQTGIVMANGGPASLTASGDLTQGPSGTTTGQSGATLTSRTGAIIQQGRVVAGNGTASLIAGAGLAQSGSVQANAGNALLTANGALSQTGNVSAATSVVIDSTQGNITLAGTTTAPNIQVMAPGGTVTFQGTLAGVQPNTGFNPLRRLTSFPTSSGPGAFISGVNVSVAASAVVTGAGGGPADLSITVANNGTATLTNFNNPATRLYLTLGTGLAAGQIEVGALQVQYTQPGNPATIDLLGAVDGKTGATAASGSFVLPLQKNNYQLNGCPIQSLNCIRITTLTLPVTNPLRDLQVLTPAQPDDFDTSLPDIGKRDY